MLTTKALLTNRDVKESPFGDLLFHKGQGKGICGANQSHHVERNTFSEVTGYSLPGVENFRAVFHIFLIANVKYVSQRV